MKFYVSTGYERAYQHGWLVEALEDQGHICTFNWSLPKVLELEPGIIALAELAAIAACDVLIVAMPGKSGTHIELGGALFLGKRVIIWAGEKEGAAKALLNTPPICPYYHHPGIEIFEGQRSALLFHIAGTTLPTTRPSGAAIMD